MNLVNNSALIIDHSSLTLRRFSQVMEQPARSNCKGVHIMSTVAITDRTDMTTKLEQLLVLDPRETAIVAVDMHRGHLDMEVATMPTKPEDAQRVITAAC